MNRWERRLRREGLTPNAGRDPRTSSFDEHISPTHGLVSSLYALSAPGDYWSDEERDRRNRVALKTLVATHGKNEVWLRIRRHRVPLSLRPVKARLLETLERV